MTISTIQQNRLLCWRPCNPNPAVSGQPLGCAKAGTHILGIELAVMVAIEGVKDGIATEPFLTADAAIAIEIIQQEDLLGGMGKAALFQHREAMGQLGFEGFDRFGEALDAFGELLVGHAVFGHHLLEALGIDAQLVQLAAGVAAVELAHQGAPLLAQLIEQFGEIVSRSQPASSMISSMLRKLAPITSVV